MNSFNELDLPEILTKSLAKMGISVPTPIQAQTVPLALKNHDILGSAQTGTGKTLAFTLPLVKHLLDNPDSTALVLAPIREIAQQVMNTLKDLISNSKDFNVALLIGGEQYPKQLAQLKARPRIIIGTPGRVIDHLSRGTLRVNRLEYLALDETDRMFDMGFGIQLDHIISKLPTKRQTLMFSATIAPAIEKLAAKYLNEPKRVAVGPTTLPIPKIKQEIIKINEKEKYGRLLQELDQRDGTVLVFVKTKINADRLANSLRKEDHAASAIHGDLRQRQREQVIRAFRQGKCRVMVATDIAARGLDIPHLMHVINYDVPPCPEDYVHRIGRTGRAGAEGFSLCFVTSQDAKKWNAIELYMSPKTSESSNRNSSPKNNFKKSEKRTDSDRMHPFANDDKRKKPFGPSRRNSQNASFGARKSKPRDNFESASFGEFSSNKPKNFKNKPFRKNENFDASKGEYRDTFKGTPDNKSRSGKSRGNFNPSNFASKSNDSKNTSKNGGFDKKGRGTFSKSKSRTLSLKNGSSKRPKNRASN